MPKGLRKGQLVKSRTWAGWHYFMDEIGPFLKVDTGQSIGHLYFLQ